MKTVFRPRLMVLFLGDIFFLGFSLWLSLFLRAFQIPGTALLAAYAFPFLFLAILSVGVFFIAGLYESRSVIFPRRTLSITLLIAQIVNTLIAALFFFFVPIFGVTPKTVLLIYLIVSFFLVLCWRVFLFPRLGLQVRESAIVVGEGKEVEELVQALRGAPHALAYIAAVVAPSQETLSSTIANALAEYKPRFVIADFSDKRVDAAFPSLYNLLAQGICFFDASALYEEVFGRVPLSHINDTWLAQHVSSYSRILYDFTKMAIDILAGFVLACVSLVFYPFIALAILLEDGFPIFIAQDRVGKNNVLVRIYKFRSMSGNDNGHYVNGATTLRVTKVGRFLRAWRFDELPQLWNVLGGNLSLIGPRLELPTLVTQYETVIPYYGVRHLIKPGLSGWAQLHYHADPHHGTDVEATKMKLAYDLYYLKHRSLTLDLVIAVQTIRRLLIRGNA